MTDEREEMDTKEDTATVVKLYRCHFCSQYIAAGRQVIMTHVQLHVEYMGKDADNRYRCPVWECPTQHLKPEDLADHMMVKHATRRKAKTDSPAYAKAERFGLKTREKLIEITKDRPDDAENLLQMRQGRQVVGRLDNRRGPDRRLDNGR